ncbi:MAG: hypothetical protein IJZ53_07735 [Tyzzerella sp.]|nr:hypothetical protein [Tyzzerella sp.]
MKSKKNIIIVVAAMVVVLGSIALMGIFRDFNAQRYVSVILNQTLLGEVTEESSIIEDASEEELMAQYESGVASFVKNIIPSGAELSEEQEAKYIEACKKVFKAMKFSVHEEEKISSKEYDVAVTYQPSDVILKYMELINGELVRMNEKVQKGEYQGTEEEINAQMQNEFLENAAVLLTEACDTMEYGEEQTMVFKVVEGENELYQISDEEMQQFLVKIMRLDEIQD